ncbi:hypothetical protein R3P38DRAFT_3237619 [Favolaschia claudopus]|uniref:Uncharacterized protein n=1 Tax=Favolaschia claudopus TaxID=2862362 RepID=A0AAV9ZBS6_9AGAR
MTIGRRHGGLPRSWYKPTEIWMLFALILYLNSLKATSQQLLHHLHHELVYHFARQPPRSVSHDNEGQQFCTLRDMLCGVCVLHRHPRLPPSRPSPMSIPLCLHSQTTTILLPASSSAPRETLILTSARPLSLPKFNMNPAGSTNQSNTIPTISERETDLHHHLTAFIRVTHSAYVELRPGFPLEEVGHAARGDEGRGWPGKRTLNEEEEGKRKGHGQGGREETPWAAVA